jgi:hypothetical protein
VIDDNWANKPIASLQAIYRSWMPQTAASLQERAKALEVLTKRFPDIGWQICIEQFGTGTRWGRSSHRPRWRSDASGAGQPATIKEIHDFGRRALDLALAWPRHDQKTLGDLVQRLRGMPEEDQSRVWDLIDKWIDAAADDKAKADLRERIRQFALTRRSLRRDLKDATRDRARATYLKLQAHDPAVRHAWLFAGQWVELSADEIEGDEFNISKHCENIDKLRATAMKEIWAEHRFDGVMALLSGSGAPHIVGSCLAPSIRSTKARYEFLRRCLSITGDLEGKVDGCIQGFLLSIADRARGTIVGIVANSANADQIVRLFRCAPFGESTWRLLDKFDDYIRDRYWQDVSPYWNHHNDAELIELIDRLLEAKRPRAAFHAVHMDWPQIETSRLKRLLLAVATMDTEPAAHYRMDAHNISAALESLEGRTGVSPDEMAQLEFLFIEALDHSEHGIPNLERQIAEVPAIFVQALALAYKRSDDGEDPPNWRIEDPKRRAAVASVAHHLLNQVKRIPGTGTDGKIDTEALFGWVTDVRRLCVEHGRAEVGDQNIGQLLSRSPADEDGVWPCISVSEVMERIASSQIATSFVIGVYNSRGVHWRGEGGAQERDLAAKYRGWAN